MITTAAAIVWEAVNLTSAKLIEKANNVIAEITGLPCARIEIILDGLESSGGVRLAKHSEGIYVMPQPTLRRMLA